MPEFPDFDDASSFWQAETAARAARASAAVAAGKATAEQAARDARLCAIVARLIDAGFIMAGTRDLTDAQRNDLFDAVDLVAAIARQARLDAEVRDMARATNLAILARCVSTATAEFQASCWVAHQLRAQGWPRHLEPGRPPAGWRIPVPA